ncbi:MAG: CPBP family intramembrane metalloprotease [Phycisphaerae bacterium]|nr:CPBP family intramembrane metalloprotease [Phycisphaerae bacterium]
MRALVLLALVPLVMWLTQTALLLRAGLPVRLRINSADLPQRLKWVNRVVTYVAFATVLLIYPPLCHSESPLTYYRGFFPLGLRPLEMLHGAAAAILYLVLLYLAWTISGNVRFEVRHDAKRLARRLAGVPLTAILAAFVEELLFRAMLLNDLLASLNVYLAVPIGVVVFAGAHYVRSVKRYWTFPGHLALGTLFSLAFVYTGALWLSLGLHAGGILVLMAVRPFIRYTGPAGLVGASIFPYAGILGILALILLSLNMWLSYGVVS